MPGRERGRNCSGSRICTTGGVRDHYQRRHILGWEWNSRRSPYFWTTERFLDGTDQDSPCSGLAHAAAVLTADGQLTLPLTPAPAWTEHRALSLTHRPCSLPTECCVFMDVILGMLKTHLELLICVIHILWHKRCQRRNDFFITAECFLCHNILCLPSTQKDVFLQIYGFSLYTWIYDPSQVDFIYGMRLSATFLCFSLFPRDWNSV